MMYILTNLFFLFFNLSLVHAQSCDSQQIAATQKVHTNQQFISSIEKFINTFYENPNASSFPPYQLLKQGELKGFDHVYNPVSKGNNSFVVDLPKAQASQYYIYCKKRQKPSLCSTPPSYVWGGMGWYEPTTLNGRNILSLNVHKNNELTMKLSKHPGFDCSGFSYAALSHFGLRVTKNMSLRPSFETADNTMARTYLDPTLASCFNEVKIDKYSMQSLHAGDVFAWTKHMAIIARVGLNPFGINHIKKVEDCSLENIRPEDSTMLLFNSKGAIDPISEYDEKTFSKNAYMKKSLDFLKKHREMLTGVGIGISKMTFREFYFIYPSVMFPLAKTWCEKKFSKENSVEKYPEGVKILRHQALDETIAKKDCECFAKAEDEIFLTK